MEMAWSGGIQWCNALTTIHTAIAPTTRHRRPDTNRHGLHPSAQVQRLLCKPASLHNHGHQRGTLKRSLHTRVNATSRTPPLTRARAFTGALRYSRHNRSNSHSLPPAISATRSRPRTRHQRRLLLDRNPRSRPESPVAGLALFPPGTTALRFRTHNTVHVVRLHHGAPATSMVCFPAQDVPHG